MEAGEYGLTRGTCFVGRRLEVVPVAGVLRISWCVFSVVGYRGIYFERTRPAASMRGACLIYLSTSNETRPKERSDRDFFCLQAKSLFITSQGRGNEADRGRFLRVDKKPLRTGVCTGCRYLISLSVCPSVRLSVDVFVSVCVTFVVLTDCESSKRPISTNPGSMEAGEYGLTREMCFVPHRLDVIAFPGLLWISWCV